MRILILDTATERGIAALIENGKKHFSIELPFGLQNAQLMLPELERSMKRQALGWDQIDLIGLSVGPGSYTGIRVGATVAKTLAYCFKIPLTGICTLDGFIPKEDGVFASLIDAKIGGIYFQKGMVNQGKVDRLIGPMLIPVSEAVNLLIDVSMVITPHINPLQKRFGEGSSFAWRECAPSAMRLAEMAEAQFNLKNYSMDGRIELLYMRKTQAEMERELNGSIFPS